MQILAESPTIPGSVIDEQEIPSDIRLVTPTVVHLTEKLLQLNCVKAENKSRLQLCLDEAITNAITHGNHNDFEKKVRITLWRDATSWGIVIADEGEGFSLEKVNLRPAESDLWRESGRGLALLTLYMDEVAFYDSGRTLLLRQFITQ